MTTWTRILIGTLSCGEREFERGQRALRRQTHDAWEQFVVQDLPEREAHRALYDRFVESAHEFDLFLKLDADMVLASRSKLGAIAALFEARPRLDHAIFRVLDWPSGSAIIGAHVFSNRARWPQEIDALFADPAPVIPGDRAYFLGGPPSPLALHCPDPAPEQAFRWGLHRGLKALRPPPGVAGAVHAASHWRLLDRLWDRFGRLRDRRLGLALLGADAAFAGRATVESCTYASGEFRALFAPCAAMDAPAIHAILAPRWASRARRTCRWACTALPGLLEKRAA